MNESILVTIKKMLGIVGDYDPFDTDIIIQINSSLFTLRQLGVHIEKEFTVTGPTETWNDLNVEDLETVKNYIYLKTKLAFDPPTSSFVLDSLQKTIAELEWRLNVEVDVDLGGVNDGRLLSSSRYKRHEMGC